MVGTTIPWHTLSSEEVLAELNTSFVGLSTAEAQARQKHYGLNQIQIYRPENLLLKFLRQMHNILIYILLISAGITIYLQHWVDTSVILGVVVINAVVGFIQEGKAEKALQAIRDLLAPTAVVLRDGRYKKVLAAALVPGDIVRIKSGDKIPADLRLLEVKNLQIQEATLTGESLPVEKGVNKSPQEAIIADRQGMAYGGTLVLTGKGLGVVVATGRDSEVGKISEALAVQPQIITPLIEKMDVVGKILSLIILIIAAFTFALGIWVWKNPLADLFMAVIGLTVAAIPEVLPAMITIILAIGVKRMAKRNAIIRKFPAVETMGEVTVICTDKTGTLTKNELVVQNILTSEYLYIINDEFKIENFVLQSAINAAILCNDAELTFHGNPIDVALLQLSQKTKIDPHFLQESFLRTDIIPYESQHKFMATLHHDHQGNAFIYVKGAPEIILSRCSWQQHESGKEKVDPAYWEKEIKRLASEGQRVIAIAKAEVNAEKQILNFADVMGNLTLLAVFGLIDPPRPEIISSVKKCKAAGVKVKMITGDHRETALTIARMVGIDCDHGVITGKEIDAMDDESFAHAAHKAHVFARTSPAHKLRLVKALQANGEIVAMTGDGVNDAPALKQANIGIAMGKKGAEIAKEASAMVLADDNFTSIVNAVEEGRTIFDNLKKAILFIIPTNAAEAFIIILAIIFNRALPISAVQIMWVNMVTTASLALALGFEKAEANVMQRPPLPPKAPILSLFLMWRVVFISTLLAAAVFGLFVISRMCGASVESSRSIAVNLIVINEVFYLINCRRIYNSTMNFTGFFGSFIALLAILIVVLLQLTFTYLPLMQHFFKVAPLNFSHWLIIVIISIVIYFLVEAEKYLTSLVLFSKKPAKIKS